MRKLPPPYVDREAAEALAWLLLNKFGRDPYYNMFSDKLKSQWGLPLEGEFKITACGWAQEESGWSHLETGEEPPWRFYVATPDYDKYGLKKMYIMLYAYLNRIAAPANRINQHDITIEKYNPEEEYQFEREDD